MALSRIYTEQRKYEDAKEAFMSCTPRTQEEEIEHILIKGLFFGNQRKFSEAIEEFQKALAMKPNDLMIKLQLLTILERGRKTGAAKLRKEIMKGPHSVSEWLNTAMYWRKIAIQRTVTIPNHWKVCQDVAQKILELDPENLHARLLIYDVHRNKFEAATKKLPPPKEIRFDMRSPALINDVIAHCKKLLELNSEIDKFIEKSSDGKLREWWRKMRVSDAVLRNWMANLKKIDTVF
jgi:tetratricopeptide (TPR) repeat protein